MANDKPEKNRPEAGNDENGAGQADPFKAELEKAKKDYLYLLADFDNYRKNAIKERSDLVKFGAERLVRDLLNVTDNFERALKNDADPAKFREGVQMIESELKALLQKSGVAEVPSEGVAFDPIAHEALGSEPSNEVPEGHVLRVLKRAYKLHDKIIRPAQVTVATKSGKNSNPS